MLIVIVAISNNDQIKEIKVTSFQDFKEYVDIGKSFDYIFDLTKEPNEKIIDGMLKYSGTLDNLLIKQDTIVDTVKKKLMSKEKIRLLKEHSIQMEKLILI